MPLKKVELTPGVNKERTQYSSEGGWFDADKVRFRQGLPEKIGGWERFSSATFLGVARSLWNWVTLSGNNLVGVGTHLKMYIEQGTAYNDITPIRSTTAAGDVTFAATNGSSSITVSDTAHGVLPDDFVTFSGSASLGGVITATILDKEYQIDSVTDVDNYVITALDASDVALAANASDTGDGGAAVVGAYQIGTGSEIEVPTAGWGGGGFGIGVWSIGETTTSNLRLWGQSNFGEDLLFNPRGGGLYYWDATNLVGTRGVNVTSLSGASDVPTLVLFSLVSDINRFAFAFGVNAAGSATIDPLLIRWSDQEDVADWTSTALNQAGSLRLTRGSRIITAVQARQEVLVWTDAALYGLQYLGAPDGWGAQILGDNTSIVSPNAAAYSHNKAFWMGRDKFYMYDGTVQPLVCDVRRHIYNDINVTQYGQTFSGIIEEFNEVWWFYCSAGSTTVDRYVIYNYVEGIWVNGTMARTAWLDSGLRTNPMAATYTKNLVYHERGCDDNETGTTAAISADITSTEFDLDDGDQFMFIKRILPDMTFDGSDAASPALSMELKPMTNSGSGYLSTPSEGGNSSATVTRTSTSVIEQFTGQVYVRVRGRQMVMKISSSAEGVAWQLGAPRLDMRPDGHRG
jgi:hypothetical protein